VLTDGPRARVDLRKNSHQFDFAIPNWKSNASVSGDKHFQREGDLLAGRDSLGFLAIKLFVKAYG